MRTTYRVLACGVLLTAAATTGCSDFFKWYGDQWADYNPNPQQYKLASGVNVVDCIVDDPDFGKEGVAYAVYARVGEGEWQQANPPEIYPIAKNSGDVCGSNPAQITFTSPGNWTVMVIEMNWGDAYTGTNTCNSSNGDHVGCTQTQYHPFYYTQNVSSPFDTIQM
ncbi:MAG: hypothetical protein U0441_10090 [Polyangiaceae bacterium]